MRIEYVCVCVRKRERYVRCVYVREICKLSVRWTEGKGVGVCGKQKSEKVLSF